jgi:hypothetical protein
MIYPIGFSIPACKLIGSVQLKTQKYGTVIPGNSRTYIFHNEKDYYNDYSKSIFGLTKCKGGWDCLRHYEILANGCIPWFEGLERCPVNTMTFLPKQLIMEAMQTCQTETNLNSERIMNYSNQLLEYTRSHLTTTAMAKYILETIGKSDVTSILYLSQDPSPDYLRCLTLEGFKELFGAQCHDVPCIPHLYMQYGEENAKRIYGKGISYTCILDRTTYRDESRDATVLEDIRSHRYDIVIYGSIHRGMPYWDEVNRVYDKNEIVLMCGEDLHNCKMKETFGKDYNLFVREL